MLWLICGDIALRTFGRLKVRSRTWGAGMETRISSGWGGIARGDGIGAIFVNFLVPTDGTGEEGQVKGGDGFK
jgi:hypothetical protein